MKFCSDEFLLSTPGLVQRQRQNLKKKSVIVFFLVETVAFAISMLLELKIELAVSLIYGRLYILIFFSALKPVSSSVD